MPRTISVPPPTPLPDAVIVAARSGDDGFVVTAQGLTVEGTPSFDQWARFGETLRRMGVALSWAVGDWLVYGEGRGDWGERYAQALDARVMTYESLRVAAHVSSRFAHAARHRNLSWSHHKAVAKFPSDAAERLLNLAETHNWSVAELREQARIVEEAERITFHEFPIGTYGLIFADVPWTRLDQPALLDMADRVRTLAATDCVLALWAPDAKVAAALEVITAWGFTYRTSAVWIKDLPQTGRYFRSRHEWLLLAGRGNAPMPAEDLRPDSVFEVPDPTTGRKPDRIYEIIEEMFPRIPRVELFATRGARPGWHIPQHGPVARPVAATPDVVSASVLDATVASTTTTTTPNAMRRAARRLASSVTGQP
jgi:N6-adenosine-specific RNA methylase IME4